MRHHLAVLATLLSGAVALADEGMWTFDNPPSERLKKDYGFTPTREWLDHLRLSSVRFNDGGSGSFVSAHGLVLTNHHVASGQLQKISTPQKDYLKAGLYAATQSEEVKSSDLEVNILVSLENVTGRVHGSEQKGASSQEALAARRAEIAKIEKESQDATGLRSDVVTLYQGGEYWLYRYKKYTDVRLVFAPEKQAAFFGGDPDNFTYPRYDLDMALFRVYENGHPIESKNYLAWNEKGAADGELVFVSGHPGSTSRMQTMAQLGVTRDAWLPTVLKTIEGRLEVLRRYSALGPEQARQAASQIFGMENGLKDLRGMYQGLQDRNVVAEKQKNEDAFRALVMSKTSMRQQYGGAWDEIAQAEKEAQAMMKPSFYRGMSSSLYGRALQIVRYVAEVQKPDGKRLPGYHDAEQDSLRFRMFSPAPVYPQMEELILAGDMERSLRELGPEDKFVKTALDGRTPREVAKDVISGTKLADPAFRKMLVEGGEAAVAASTDPLIVLARKLDPVGREMIKWQEDHVESVVTAAGERIGAARFELYGKSDYPDATFTLRLSYGVVKGYPMNGTIAPSKTTFYGLYDRTASFDGKPPFDIPERFVERRAKLDLTTPLNFVSTCDIIGGNSGSPVINRNGELVGLIFDGNIEGLVGDYLYNDLTGRAVAVHSAGMISALRKLYDAGALADEIQGKR